ncbi:MAG: flagellar hook-length control protein FliK [Pseudomonadota bacterium]
MIAGLLGEHLASPRTATKTNQNTALEPKRPEPEKSSAKDGFDSYVNKDAEGVQTDTAAAENAVAATQSDAAPTSEPPINAKQFALAGSPHPTLDGAPAAAPELATTQVLAPSPEGVPATNEAGAEIKPARGEVLNQDPRLAREMPGTPTETALDPRNQPVKLVEDAPTPIAIEDRLHRHPDSAQTAIADSAQVVPDDVDTVRTAQRLDAVTVETPEAQARQLSVSQSTADGATNLTTPKEIAATTSAEPFATLGAATIPNAPATVSTAGLTPTAPSIPVASPGDLTGIILNALQNGGDAQEQLVVQLDPPELGRVMIDFKFDANGVQQVIVTSENPEALKRLREMHFELTEALRQQGLSDTNMSFRQEAEDRSQHAWQSPERTRQEAHLIAAEDRRASPSAVSNDLRMQVRDRLDLLL